MNLFNNLNLQSKYFIFKRSYKTLPSFNENTNKAIGEIKHFPPAIKEWSNSMYAFNKSNSRDLLNNEVLTNDLIKSYFHMEKLSSRNTKSKRMRDLIKRSSTKQLFVSKSVVKQTNDTAIINIFVFDRLKKKFNKRLFYLKNDIKNIVFNNEVKRKLKRKQFGKIVSRFSINYNTYPKLLNTSFVNKKQTLKSLFFFYFLKWSLSAFYIRICFLKKGDTILQNNIKHNVNNCIVIFSKLKQNTVLKKNKNKSKVLILNNKEYYKIIIKDKFNIKTIILLNDILYKYLYILISNAFYGSFKNILQIKTKILFLFWFFKNKYYKSFVRKYLRKEYLALTYLYRLYINKAKLNNLLPGLKYILSQMYNKKIELNIVNLKYLHLNSDIYTNAISIKLKKKTSKLLRVLRKSLKLVKIPQKMRTDGFNLEGIYLNKLYTGMTLNNLYQITNKLVISTNNNFKDKVNSVVSNMFSNKANDLSIHNSILTSVKYKWITGVRLEAKGRLTKRFTASRSLFKFKYKGNLKNLDYLNKSINIGNNGITLNKTPNLYMIRNEHKPNIQYTNINSKKRIGTFGIKGWISNN